MAVSGTSSAMWTVMCIGDIIRTLIDWQLCLLSAMGYLLCVMAFCLLLLAVCLTLLAMLLRQQKPHLLTHLREPDASGHCPLVVGLFHPYCNAGGGGERVLWVAIRALYTRYPNVKCVVYTGDTDVTGEEIMARARQRFNLVLPRPVEFVFLERRKWVEASPYPCFTLLGQSLGSMMLGMEALTKCVPDIYIDTMGYAFTIPLFRYLGGCHVACYVHYPTISTDMLALVTQRTASYNNAQFIVQSPILSSIKICYYRLFAYIYGVVGNRAQIVMVNSSWTAGHIHQIWAANDKTHVVFPPCDTKEFLSIPLTDKSNNKTHFIVSVAQFRPEKDHPLQIRAFSEFLVQRNREETNNYKLVLVGSCRNEEDSKRVEALKELASELGVEEQVEFRLNVSFAELKRSMEEATVGIHTMWKEHFGIGVVELMAAGTVTLAHNSGGPKLDIVVPHDGAPTGYLADSAATYTDALNQIFSLSNEDSMELRRNARESVKRFSEEEFEQGFIAATEPLFVT